MTKNRERRAVTLKSDGQRSISGTLVPYGVPTEIGNGLFREVFDRGAFGDVQSADVVLNLHHDRARPLARTQGGGLTLTDSNSELRLDARLPETRDAADASTLVQAGVLGGLSVEFFADEESWEGNLRRIHAATLADAGLVDRPAYEGAVVEIRAAHDRRKKLKPSKRNHTWL